MKQLMITFRSQTAPDHVLAGVRAGEITAFCMFAGINVTSPAQARALNDTLYAAAAAGGLPPPIVGTDQEGGQLIAIASGATELPGNMALGATRSTALAEQAGIVLARELLAMGFNMNFAPCLDVNNNPENPVVGTRSFGDDPALVGELGAAMIRGMQREGVLAVAKHFPGHGDTSGDSHYLTPAVREPIERLRAVELPSFEAAVRARVAAVLTAHVVYTALDTEQPATLSRPILTGLLREKMAYDGLILTDAMDMHAVSARGAGLAVSQALQAGVDLALLGHLPDQEQLALAMQPLENADSVRRIARARAVLPRTLPPLSVVGCAEHQAIAQEIADRSITLVRDRAGALPLQLPAQERLGLVYVRPANLTPADTSSAVQLALPEALARRHANLISASMPFQGSDADVRACLEAVAGCGTVIVGTMATALDPRQVALVDALRARGQHVIAVALRIPYDVMAFPAVDTCLCAYSVRAVSMEALARVLFGEREAQGRLPVHVPGV